MEPRLAEDPATRWDRLVAVLEDVDPQRVIDASHIIERQRKLKLTDLELFYILSMRYQETNAGVLTDVLNLYVLISTWMDWLARCDVCLTSSAAAATACMGKQSGRGCAANLALELASQPLLESSVTVHNRLHPVAVPSHLRSPESEDLDTVMTDSVVMSSDASPLIRSVTTVPGSAEGELASSQQLFSARSQQTNSSIVSADYHGSPTTAKRNLNTANGVLDDLNNRPSGHPSSKTSPLTRNSSASKRALSSTVRPSTSQPSGRTFLSQFDLPPNWADDGTVNFLRDGKLLCSLVETAFDVASKVAAASQRTREPVNPYPSLADLDRMSGGKAAGKYDSLNALGQLNHITISSTKPRGYRRSKSSRAMRIMEEQEKTVVENEKIVSRLNRLCEEHLGWSPAANSGERFFSLCSTDRMLRPLNVDDYEMVRRLHWVAVALFHAVNNPAIVPLPSRVSFLLTGHTPEAPVDDAEEKSEMALLIATKCSCLPHNSKLQLTVVDGNVVKLSHPTAHPQPLLYPCCIVDGEVFLYVSNRQQFVPLWRLLRRLLELWDHAVWNYELPALDRLADKLLNVSVAVPAPPPRTSVCGNPPLSPFSLHTSRQFRSPSDDFDALASSTPAGCGALYGVLDTTDSHQPFAMSQTYRMGSGAKPVSGGTSFNLTIKTSTIRHGRALSNTTSPQIPVPHMLSSFRATEPHQNRSFAEDGFEENSSASFGPASAVRGGRRATPHLLLPSAHDVASVGNVPEQDTASQRLPMSVAVRASRAAPCSPLSPSRTHHTLSRAATVGSSAQKGEVNRGKGAAAAKKQTVAAPNKAAQKSPSLSSPSSSSSSTGFHSARDFDEDEDRPSKVMPSVLLAASSRTVGYTSKTSRAGNNDHTEETTGAEYDDAPIASATLSAVHPTSLPHGQVSPVMNDIHAVADRDDGESESFREENLTPPQEGSESSTNNHNSTFTHSEVRCVKNFSAMVIHESHESGINVRDHHFRVSGRPVGKGAFGAVYRALDLETGVIVAVKQSRYSIDANDQHHLNWREFQTWSMLPAHPNVITFYGASKEAETRQLLLVLEFASGGSITAMYQNYRPIPEHLFLQHARGIALGLKHLHDHNVIHGDMKPENVLTRSDGSVAITDFGCSRLTRRASPNEDEGPAESFSSTQRLSTTSAGVAGWQLFGTAAFMAPEVITNEPDYKSDVWAYVCTLGYLWFGRAPWAEVPDTMYVHDSIPLMFYIASNEDAVPFTPAQLAQSPRWLQRLAQRAFEHDVEKRSSMSEVLSILAEYS